MYNPSFDLKSNIISVWVLISTVTLFYSCSPSSSSEIYRDLAATNSKNIVNIKYDMDLSQVKRIMKVSKFHEDIDNPVSVEFTRENEAYKIFYYFTNYTRVSGQVVLNDTRYTPITFINDKVRGINWDDYLKFFGDTLITKETILKISENTRSNSILPKTKSKSQTPEPIGHKKRDKVPGGSGTGFLLDISGYLITNFHVVENAENIKVVFTELNKSYNAKIRYKDENNDLVLLQLDSAADLHDLLGELPYSIDFSGNVNVGQDVFTLGYPLSNVLGSSNSKLSNGIINGLTGLNEDPRLYQISIPIQPGNSGSPLLNYDGEVIGVIVSTLNSIFFLKYQGILPQNVNFAIKSNHIKNLIDLIPGKSSITLRKSNLKGLKLEQLYDRIKKYVAQIITNSQ